jgi:hypothetical protein
VFTCGPYKRAGGGHMFHVVPSSGHVQLLAGPPISSACNLPEPPDAGSDWVPGCGWGAPEVQSLPGAP